MLVVSDTSPLTALLKIGRAGLLRQLFSEVLIPPAVESELLRNHPLLPAWLEVRPPKNIPARIGNLVISTASSPIRNSSRRKRTTTASRLTAPPSHSASSRSPSRKSVPTPAPTAQAGPSSRRKAHTSIRSRSRERCLHLVKHNHTIVARKSLSWWYLYC